MITRPQTLSKQAYKEVRRAVRDGLIVPGTFYSELQIAKELGISRTPVREALIELSREGMIEKAPQRGFSLRTISDHEQDEVFELRALLESHAARRLAREASEQDIRTLRHLLDRQAKLLHNESAFLEVDEEFHLSTATLLRLDRTREVLLTLRGIMWIAGLAAISRSHRMSDVLQEHRAILERIEARDSAGASRAVHHHVRTTARAARASTLRIPQQQSDN